MRRCPLSRISRTAITLALASALSAGAAQAATTTHSGTIVAVDLKRQTITLEEMGPWTGPGSGLVKRTIRLAPGTTFELVARSKEPAPGGWPGGFVASSLKAVDLRPGDFATVTTEGRTGHLAAASIDVVRPAAG